MRFTTKNIVTTKKQNNIYNELNEVNEKKKKTLLKKKAKLTNKENNKLFITI